MKETSYSKVLEWCENHGSITAREAFIHLNINSPRKVFSDLRRKGYETQDPVREYTENGKHYNRYFFKRAEA